MDDLLRFIFYFYCGYVLLITVMTFADNTFGIFENCDSPFKIHYEEDVNWLGAYLWFIAEIVSNPVIYILWIIRSAIIFICTVHPGKLLKKHKRRRN